MQYLIAIIVLMGTVLVFDAAMAQQPPQPVPLTGERAALDIDISKISMPREAHMAIYNILQAYERLAMEKMPRPMPATPDGPSK
jgi:hypothetical protein